MKRIWITLIFMVVTVLCAVSCITVRTARSVTWNDISKMAPFDATVESVDISHPFFLYSSVEIWLRKTDGGERLCWRVSSANKYFHGFARSLQVGQRYSFPKVIQDYLTGTNTTNNNLMNNTAATQRAYEKLLSVKCFALGGIGFAGLTSPGESNFRVIASNTNALQIFQKILTNGTVEAQLYALCGIRLEAPDKFDADAKPIIVANKIVSEMQGCIETEVTASNIVARIKGGWYDSYLARDR